jgi:hypothetical protein
MGTRLTAARANSVRPTRCRSCDFVASLTKADRAEWDAGVADPMVSWPGLVAAFADLNPPNYEAVRTCWKRGHRVEA